MVVEGKLITCKRERKDFNGKKTEEKLFITLAEVDLSDDKIKELKEAFKDSGKNFTPSWVKDFDGFVNVSTKFELPCIDLEGKEWVSIEDMIADTEFSWHGALCALSLNVKEGAVYPQAIKIMGEGIPFDPYAEFR